DMNILRILRQRGRHVRGRVAARVERDAAIAAREESELRLPASIVAGELVYEHDRRAAARFLVVELHTVHAQEGHRRRSFQRGSKGEPGSCAGSEDSSGTAARTSAPTSPSARTFQARARSRSAWSVARTSAARSRNLSESSA